CRPRGFLALGLGFMARGRSFGHGGGRSAAWCLGGTFAAASRIGSRPGPLCRRRRWLSRLVARLGDHFFRGLLGLGCGLLLLPGLRRALVCALDVVVRRGSVLMALL